MPAPRYESTIVTPEMAAEILRSNSHNRGVRARHVAALADDMERGAWRDNGETIKIAADGTLIDGQHRLHAIIGSNTSQRMMIVRDLSMSVQETIDTGAKRSFADALRLRGEVNVIDLASVTRRVDAWERGFHRPSSATVMQPTFAQLSATLEAHPEIRDSATVAKVVTKVLRVQTSIIGLCHWVFDGIDEPDAKGFFDQLAEADGLRKGDPVHTLRRSIVDLRGGTRNAGMSDDMLAAWMIKTWNAYRQGRQMSLVRWRAGGVNPEAFPEPI
jgi:hypothetical protein